MNEVLLDMLSYYGIKEIPGAGSNDHIIAMFHSIGFEWVKNDETAWCSAAINYFCKRNGYERSGKLDARSWLKVGTLIEKPQVGDVVVFWRDSIDSWKGHVALYISEDNDKIYVLGGNQNNMINISSYSKSHVLGYRRLSKIIYTIDRKKPDLNQMLEEHPIKINIISLIKLYRLIRKYLRKRKHQKSKIMCFKKIWQSVFGSSSSNPVPDPVEPSPQPTWGKKILLLFGTNYIGKPYQLSGCLNDIDDEKATFETYFTGWDIRVWKGVLVVAQDMFNIIRNAILTADPAIHTLIRVKYSGHGTTVPNPQEADGCDEALFTEQGLFTDEMISELEAITPSWVTVKWDLDSCMSGGMEDNRALTKSSENIVFLRNRFIPNPEVPETARVIKRLTKGKAKFVMAAGCQENQTCADATFSGRANGAYTYYNLKRLREGVSFREEMDNVHEYLPGHGFDQDPVLLGDSSKFNFIY